MVTPKRYAHVHFSEPVNITWYNKRLNVPLFGERVFADVIKLRTLTWGNHPGLSKWDRNPVTSVLIEKCRRTYGTDRRRHRQRRRGSNGEGRDRSSGASREGTWWPPETGRGKERRLLQHKPPERVGPCEYFISVPWPPEQCESNFSCFKPPSLRFSVTEASGNKWGSWVISGKKVKGECGGASNICPQKCIFHNQLKDILPVAGKVKSLDCPSPLYWALNKAHCHPVSSPCSGCTLLIFMLARLDVDTDLGKQWKKHRQHQIRPGPAKPPAAQNSRPSRPLKHKMIELETKGPSDSGLFILTF